MRRQAAFRVATIDGQPAKATKTGKGGRPTNEAMGRRGAHLTTTEIRPLLDAAGNTGRKSLRKRNRPLLLMMYRHGLRVSELVRLRWQAGCEPAAG